MLIEPVTPAIGSRLRRARLARGSTLQAVAEEAGLTKGHLSQIERDIASPSIAALVRICSILDLDIGALFAPATTSLVRADERPGISLGGVGVREFQLAPAARGLRVTLTVIEPGGGSGDEPYGYDGEAEFLLVLAGSLEITVDGESFVLEQGDALTFGARDPRTWRNPSASEPAQALWVWTPSMAP